MARKRIVKFYKDNKRNYETCILISNRLDDSALKTRIEELKKIITNIGEEVIEVMHTRVKDFAYQLKKQKEQSGYFVCFYIKSSADKIDIIKNKLKVENDVLRIMTLLAKPKKQSYGIFSSNYEENYKNKNKFISYDDPNYLIKFLGERACIIQNDKSTHNKKQRSLANSIKQARILSILPFTGATTTALLRLAYTRCYIAK